MARNVCTTLRRRPQQDPMRAHDRLPPDLRRWIAEAALPWSAASVLRLWRKALAEAGGDPQAACARLDAAQARLLARDAPRVWGAAHPACQTGALANRR